MSNNYFDFKRFRVEQNNVSMRVNTDGVLLGAWFSVPENKVNPSVLDVGCATGVIALIAAQKIADENCLDFSCDGVETDFSSCIQAQKNFEASPWKKHLPVYFTDFVLFSEVVDNKYDAIISNPPYFNNSLKNPSPIKKNARHTDSLSYSGLIASSARILKGGGCLSVILPYEEFGGFEEIAKAYGLKLKRSCNVFSKEGDASPIRTLGEFQKQNNIAEEKIAEVPVIENLCIMTSDGGFTSDYKALTQALYLKF